MLLFSVLPSGLLDLVSHHWLLLLGSLLPAIYWYTTRNHDFWKKRGINGPPVIPLIGNFFSLSTPFVVLHSQYLSQYGKVFGLFVGQKPQLMIAEPDIIKRILVKDFHLFRNRFSPKADHRIFGQSLANTRDVEQWKRLRSILTPMFTSLKLKKMEETMNSCVSALLTSLDSMAKSQKTFEARSPMGNFTLDIIAKTAFATETNAHQEEDNVFLQNAKGFFVFSWARFLGAIFLPRSLQQWLIDNKWTPIYLKEWTFFETISRHLIKERRETKIKHNDLLQLMVNAEHNVDVLAKTFKEDLSNQIDGHHVNAGMEELEKEENELQEIVGSKYLSEEEIMAQALVFFLAGYETTASLLGYTLYELAINPDIQERLYGEIQKAKEVDAKLSISTLNGIHYLDAVISEALRKYPPATMTAREVGENDYEIPELKLTLSKGQTVLIPIFAMQRSEMFFSNPEKYDPERFMPENSITPYTYLPFGGGPRNCIGMRFALTEAKMGLSRIIDQFRVVRVAETTDKLTILQSAGLLKTSEIYLGVQRR